MEATPPSLQRQPDPRHAPLSGGKSGDGRAPSAAPASPGMDGSHPTIASASGKKIVGTSFALLRAAAQTTAVMGPNREEAYFSGSADGRGNNGVCTRFSGTATSCRRARGIEREAISERERQFRDERGFRGKREAVFRNREDTLPTGRKFRFRVVKASWSSDARTESSSPVLFCCSIIEHV
jgi:hypothetical protein